MKSLTRPRGFDEFAAALTGGGDSDGPAPTRWAPQDPTEKQARFLGLTCLEALYGGAAGGGKSSALLMAALQYVDVPGYSALLLRRTFTDLALPGAIMDRAHEWLGGTAAKWNDRDKTWSFPSGATLTFGYLEGPRDHFRYQGAEFQFVGFDELTQFEEPQYRYLFSRLRRLSGASVPLRMRGATNPGGIGHEWVKARLLGGAEGRVFVPATLDDNPHLDRAEYEAALAELDPVTRQQLREGLWVQDTSGLVYYSFSAKNLVAKLPDLPNRERWYRVLGCDFGVVDPTAYVELAFAEHVPEVYVTRAGQWPGLSPSESCQEAMRWEADADGYDAIVGDTGGLGKGFEAEWATRFAMPMRAAKKADKLGYIKLINGDLHHARLLFVTSGAGVPELVEDVRALPWADAKHNREHPAAPNHRPDALLYGWREARHWAWEARDESTEAELRRAARRGMDEHERWEVEQLELEQERLGQNELWMAGMGREWPQ